MRSLLASAPSRAGLFFAAAFLVATLLGALGGDARLGMATGVGAGLVLAAFGYLFVRPA